MNETVRARRSPRDWLVDSTLFVLAALMALFMASATRAPGPEWLLQVDQLIGVLGCLALWWRKRAPVLICAVLVVLSCFAALAAGPLLAALFTVAVHRPVRTTILMVSTSLVAALVFALLRPEPEVPTALAIVLTLALHGGAVAWGLVVRNGRQLIQSLRERAEGAATEARLRSEQAQHEAREELAREIHDVLGHRLSLLSVHAGALGYRRDPAPEEIARAAEVIRESAHRALQDLREVIGVLRAPVGELPQPALADVTELVTDSRQAGADVTFVDLVRDAVVPETAGRTLYRTVQEGLTNARKYAPDAAVTVCLDGTPDGELRAEIVNSATATQVPAAADGRGLVGLAERAALTGGTVEHGPTADGGWRLEVRVPWPT